MPQDFEDHCWKDIISPEILKTYEPYKREVSVGKDPALLVIDLYNQAYQGDPKKYPHELVDDYPNSCGKYAWDAIEPIQILISTCRAAKIPAIFVTASTRKGRVTSTKRQIGSDIENELMEIHPAFKIETGDLVIRKERASAFHSTSLIAQLNRLKVRSLIVCGESTSGCVRASVVDAYSYGYHVSIAEECVYDRSMLSHKVNLFDMHHKYADVMALTEIKTSLDERYSFNHRSE